MAASNITLSQLSPSVVQSVVPPALQSRPDRRNGTRPGAIPAPILRFSDLISGPATGLGDGLGSGVIVTVWGQGFGDVQGEVLFTDSLGVERPATHIYYWKRADGQLPSGPSNLWDSHLMYEVAFSIPSGSADGLGSVRIRKPESGSYSVNTLPFTVRAGRILWIAPTGNNANAGTFASPKEYINGGDSNSRNGLGNSLQAGDTVYSRGVTETSLTERGIVDSYPQYAMFVRTPTVATEATQVMLVSYPNTLSQVLGLQKGFNPYLAVGVGLSKWKMEVGHVPTSDEVITSVIANSHISLCKWGRYVGNELSDKTGMCSTGQAGAIVSGADGSHGTKVYGNYLHDIGCNGTSHFQHTTYFSIRNKDFTDVAAWEFSFNYLARCKAKFGYHAYDQADGGGSATVVGNVVGTVKVNNNVFYKQKGAGISMHTSQTSFTGPIWTCSFEARNNILIECGLGPIAETGNGTAPYAMKFGDRWEPISFVLEHNLIYRYSDPTSRVNGAQALAVSLEFRNQPSPYKINSNTIVSDGDFTLISTGVQNIAVPTSADYNVSYSLDSTNTKTLPPSWTNSINGTPLALSVFYTLPDVMTTSPLNIGGSLPSSGDDYDFYGRPRSGTIGPVEVV